MGLKHWIVKQAIKRRIQKMRKEGRDVSKILAIVNALKNPKASEMWVTVATAVLALLYKFVPGAPDVIATVAGFFGAEPAMFVAAALTYIAGRLGNKAANAE